MRSAFTGDDDVFPAVAVEVVDADLQADAGAFACRRRGDDVLGPGAGFGDPVVVLNGDVVMGAGVFAGVGVIAFAGDEFRLPSLSTSSQASEWPWENFLSIRR